MDAWVERELGDSDFPDQRLKTRLGKLLGDLRRRIGSSHDDPAPLLDAQACVVHAEEDALILFHDLAPRRWVRRSTGCAIRVGGRSSITPCRSWAQPGVAASRRSRMSLTPP
jgi:hypothetical protein